MILSESDTGPWDCPGSSARRRPEAEHALRRGEATAAELAQHLRWSVEATREHLDAAVRAGRVMRRFDATVRAHVYAV